MKHSILNTLPEIPHHTPMNTLFLVLNNSVSKKVPATSLKKDPAFTVFYLADQK